MTASTNVPYWIVALRVGCVLSQVIAASGDLSLKLSRTPEYKFTNNGLSLTTMNTSSSAINCTQPPVQPTGLLGI